MSLLWWFYSATQVNSMATALSFPHLEGKGGKILWKDIKSWGGSHPPKGSHPLNTTMSTNCHHVQDRLSIGRLIEFITYHRWTTTVRNSKQTKNTIPPIQPLVTPSPEWSRGMGIAVSPWRLFPLLLDNQSLPSLGPSCGMPSFLNGSCTGP